MHARDRARRALETAVAAAHALSIFKQRLGKVEAHARPSPRNAQAASWSYDSATRTVTDRAGHVVATLAPTLDATCADVHGALIAELAVLRDAALEAQHLCVLMLTGAPRPRDVEVQIRELLERLNEVSARLDP